MKKDNEIKETTENGRKTRGSSKPEVLMPVPASLLEMPEGYAAFFSGLKERITRERIKAVLSANSAMVLMYWDIGQAILERQQKEGWGAKVIDRLSHDLKKAFPDMTGFSPRNLKYMRKFAESWPERSIVQEVLAQITWYHNLALLEKATIRTSGCGTQIKHWNTVGVATSWRSRLKPVCTSGKARRSTTFKPPYPRLIRTWPPRFSKTPTSLTFWARQTRAVRPNWSKN